MLQKCAMNGGFIAKSRADLNPAISPQLPLEMDVRIRKLFFNLTQKHIMNITMSIKFTLGFNPLPVTEFEVLRTFAFVRDNIYEGF